MCQDGRHRRVPRFTEYAVRVGSLSVQQETLCARKGRRRRVSGEGARDCAVADVVFIVLTIVLFALLALVIRGVERL
jgi:hypothetical protein